METIFARFAWLSGKRAVGDTYNAWVNVSQRSRSHIRKERQHLRVADRTLCLTLKV